MQSIKQIKGRSSQTQRVPTEPTPQDTKKQIQERGLGDSTLRKIHAKKPRHANHAISFSRSEKPNPKTQSPLPPREKRNRAREESTKTHHTLAANASLAWIQGAEDQHHHPHNAMSLHSPPSVEPPQPTHFHHHHHCHPLLL